MGRALLLAAAGALLTLASGCTSRGAAGPAPPPESLAGRLTAFRERYRLPAVAGAVVRRDKITDLAAIGVRRLGSPVQVTTNDRFHVGSNAKAMTSTMLAALVEEGKLTWDTTPLDVFPELRGKSDPVFEKITLAQLLSHRAGLPAFHSEEELRLARRFHGTPVEERYAFAVSLLQGKPAAEPGTYLYSNAGYSVAGAMAERVTGQSWEALMQARLFDPMKCKASFGWPALTDPNQPWGHWRQGRAWIPNNPHGVNHMPAIFGPAGDVSLSVTDYAKFVQMHLRGLHGCDSVVKATTFQRLHQPRQQYALGWGEVDTPGEWLEVHTGSAGTFVAAVAMAPEHDRAVVLMTNACDDQVVSAAREVAISILHDAIIAARSAGKESANLKTDGGRARPVAARVPAASRELGK